jgi:hypothetical protein
MQAEDERLEEMSPTFGEFPLDMYESEKVCMTGAMHLTVDRRKRRLHTAHIFIKNTASATEMRKREAHASRLALETSFKCPTYVHWMEMSAGHEWKCVFSSRAHGGHSSPAFCFKSCFSTTKAWPLTGLQFDTVIVVPPPCYE